MNSINVLKGLLVLTLCATLTGAGALLAASPFTTSCGGFKPETRTLCWRTLP